MIKIRVGIIEDEDKSMSMLKGMLVHYFENIEIIGTAANVEQGMELLQNHAIDVLFLDIHLAGGNAFDLLQMVKVDCDIVFTTAYEEYARKAFGVKALHYLLKPIMLEDIKTALERHLEKRMIEQKVNQEAERLNQNLTSHKEKIAIPTSEGIQFVEIKKIIRIQSANRYTIIYVDKVHYIATKPLYHFEDLFKHYHFSRIHDSHLINLDYLQAYHKGRGGEVEMVGGLFLEVSIRRKQNFLNELDEYAKIK